MNKLKLVCMLVVLTMMFTLLGNGIVLSATIDSTDSIGGEKKVYSTATIDDNFDENTVLVVLTNSASLTNLEYTPESFSELNCKRIRNLSQTTTDWVSAKLSGQQLAAQRSISSEYAILSDFYSVNTSEFHQILSIELTEPGKENVLSATKKLEQRTDVLYAGPNYVYEVKQPELALSLRTVIPWDAFINAQDSFEIINLSEAWELSNGSARRVTVGIIDMGVDQTHPELSPLEGDSASWEIDVSGDKTAVAIATDEIGHGTKVAGIIGAKSFNGGICGINGNVEIVSLNIFDSENQGYSLAAMIEAIDIAKNQGIPILNVSLGIEGDEEDITALTSSIQQYNGLIICSAGNDGRNLDELTNKYPRAIDSNKIIVVGASTLNDVPRADSNYHPEDVDLFAPGENVLTCIPRNMCSENCTSVVHYDYGYHYGSQTSIATPHVSGVTSLLLAMYPNQVMSYSALRYHILNGVDICDSLIGKCATGGRLNAYKVLSNHIMGSYYLQNDNIHHQSCCVCHGWVPEEHDLIDIGGVQYCTVCEFYVQ